MADANRAIQLQLFLTGEKPTVKGLKNVNKASAQAAAGVQKVGGAARATGAKMPPLTSSMKGTTGAVINFNRVIQDAPFGLIGVANNIDPLIISFKDLKNQTGSTGKAMRTLIGSAFMGPLGIVTIMSLATSIMLAFGPKIKEAFGKLTQSKVSAMQKRFNELREELKETNTELQTLIDTFNGLDPLQAEQTRAQHLETVATKDYLDQLAIVNDLEERLTTAKHNQRGAIQSKLREERNELKVKKENYDTSVQANNEIKDTIFFTEATTEKTREKTKAIADETEALHELARARSEASAAAFGAGDDPGDRIVTGAEQVTGREGDVLQGQARIDAINAEKDADAALAAQREANLNRWRESLAKAGAQYAINAIQHKKSADQIIKDIGRMIAKQLIFNLLKGALSGATGGSSSLFSKAAGFLGFDPPQARQGVTNFSGGPLQVHKDELIFTPPGTTVLSQSASRQAMRDGGGTQQVAVYLNGDLANLVDAIEVLSDRNARTGVGPILGNQR